MPYPGGLVRTAELRGYALFSEKVTAYGRTYNGPVQECVFTFKTGPEQLGFLDSWLRDRYVGEMTKAVEQEGGKIVKIVLERDIGPIFDTWWRGSIIADISGELQQPGVHLASPFPWVAVLAFGFVSVIAYFFLTPFIESVTDFWWGRENGLGIPWPILIVGVIAVMFLWPRVAPKREAEPARKREG